MATVFDIADWFLASVDREAGDAITHLKLQKLVYYAQAWSLALRDEQLFDDDFQAWAHGPVVRALYDRHSDSGWYALAAPDGDINIGQELVSFLTDISESYGELGAKQLEELTHSEAPWINARNGLPPEARTDAIISKESISAFYKEQFEKIDGDG